VRSRSVSRRDSDPGSESDGILRTSPVKWKPAMWSRQGSVESAESVPQELAADARRVRRITVDLGPQRRNAQVLRGAVATVGALGTAGLAWYGASKGALIAGVLGSVLGPFGTAAGIAVGAVVGAAVGAIAGLALYRLADRKLGPNAADSLQREAEHVLSYLQRGLREGGAGVRFSDEEADRLNALRPEDWRALLSVTDDLADIPEADRAAARSLLQAGAILKAAEDGCDAGFEWVFQQLGARDSEGHRSLSRLDAALMPVIQSARPHGEDAIERALDRISGLRRAGREAQAHAWMAFEFLTGRSEKPGARLELTADDERRLDSLDKGTLGAILDVPEHTLNRLTDKEKPRARFLMRTCGLLVALKEGGPAARDKMRNLPAEAVRHDFAWLEGHITGLVQTYAADATPDRAPAPPPRWRVSTLSKEDP
jgi:hypothetical protein